LGHSTEEALSVEEVNCLRTSREIAKEQIVISHFPQSVGSPVLVLEAVALAISFRGKIR